MERCIVGGGRLALVAALLAVAAGHATPHTMPARLTGAAHGGYDTAYGNGHFGHWTTDRFGLPAFVYTADEARDPAARWSDNAGAAPPGPSAPTITDSLGGVTVAADPVIETYSTGTWSWPA